MPTSLLANLIRLANSLSAQAVIIAVIIAGITMMITMSEPLLILALLTAYLAGAVLLASLAAPELAFVVALLGIFSALMMNFTAAERRSLHISSRRNRIPASFRLLLAALALWVVWSLGLLRQPLQPMSFTTVWELAVAAVALATATDAFKAGIVLLLLLSDTLLYYATSTAEVSLLVIGVAGLASFAISLAASHLALLQPSKGEPWP